MTSAAYALSPGLGLLADDSDRRFRRLLAIFATPALILGLVIPFIHVAGLLKDVALITPMRQADLPKVGGPLQANVVSSSTGTNPGFAKEAGKTSGGIGDTAAIGRVGSSTSIGDRNTAKVRSKIGEGRDSGAGTGGKASGRTLEELQLVFDRAKGAFYTMYQRELRQNASMRGKVVLRITIAPSGHVTRCSVVSSELHDPEFEKKVVARVLLMDFGPKAVGDFTVDYPIYFFPQN